MVRLAYIKNENIYTITVNESDSSSLKREEFKISELPDLHIHALFIDETDNEPSNEQEDKMDQDTLEVSQEAIEEQNLQKERLARLSEVIGLFPAAQYSISLDSWLTLNAQDALTLQQKTYSPWVMKNNLSTLKNLFSLSQEMKNVRGTNLELFFSQVWKLLKKNLGAENLRIIYNDVIVETNENDKEKDKITLVTQSIAGELECAKPQSLKEEKELLKSYVNKSSAPYYLDSFNSDQKEFVAVARVDESPFLIMGKVPHYDALKENLLFAFFSGLQ